MALSQMLLIPPSYLHFRGYLKFQNVLLERYRSYWGQDKNDRERQKSKVRGVLRVESWRWPTGRCLTGRGPGRAPVVREGHPQECGGCSSLSKSVPAAAAA